MLHDPVVVVPPLVDVLPPEPPLLLVDVLPPELLPPLVDVLPPELLPPLLLLLPLLPPDEDDPPLVDVLPPPADVLPEETRGGFAHDSATPTIRNTTLTDVSYRPGDGVCVHTFQLEVCTTERRSSLASAYVTDATWWARASATAFRRFHPPYLPTVALTTGFSAGVAEGDGEAVVGVADGDGDTEADGDSEAEGSVLTVAEAVSWSPSEHPATPMARATSPTARRP
ncbi:hypothetical protein OG786_22725 [Streptomyces sp. NBC_00101]|uniref:hypothetical protein n=1 Tax=Streptomyces sp. NBC_00101 TaxID=2975651 RepID=UPI003252A81D